MADTYYIAIVAKKNPKYGSGHEVADHVRNADTLVKVELYSGETSYHPLNLPKEQEKLPGQKLVGHINQNHPNLNTLVTGDRRLEYQGLKEGIVNDFYQSGKDVQKVIDKYKAKYKTYEKAA